MDETNYFQGAQGQILELMRKTFGDKFNVYYDGLPTDSPPEAAFPMCIVHKTDAAVSLGATGQDVLRSQIQIHFLVNQVDDLNKTGTVQVTQKRLQMMVEGRDKQTGQWMPGTAMHALATNQTLGETTVEMARDISYDLTFRPDELPTVMEAVVQIITSEKVPVPLRN